MRIQGCPEALVRSPLAPSARDYLRMNLYVPDGMPSMKRSSAYSPGADLKSAMGKPIVLNLTVAVPEPGGKRSGSVRSNGFAWPRPSVSVPRTVTPRISFSTRTRMTALSDVESNCDTLGGRLYSLIPQPVTGTVLAK